MDIIAFRHDPKLLGRLPHMRRPETQRAWDTFLKALYGLEMDEHELSLFRLHTGRTTPLPGGYSEAACITGRQSGKTQTAGDILAFEALTAPDDGTAEGTYAIGVAQDHRGAMRSLLRYATTPFERVPMLSKEVSGTRTADTLTLRSGIALSAYPCRPSAIRGIRARVAVVDELAFFRSSDGNPTDQEMLRAIRPTLSMQHGKLIVLSSPYFSSGALYDLHRAHWAREDSSTLIWMASAPAMNGLLPADYLARMERDDPAGYAAEILGQFRAGEASLFDPLVLENCQTDWTELPPTASSNWKAFADFSSQRSDASALALGFPDGDRGVVGLLRTWPAKTSTPEGVVAEMAEILRAYGCTKVVGDRYAIGFVESSLRRHHISFEPSQLDKSRLYLELIGPVQAGMVSWPKNQQVMKELRSLDRRRGFAGRDRVDARGGNAHEDLANALAGCVHLITRRRRGGGPPSVVVGGGGVGHVDNHGRFVPVTLTSWAAPEVHAEQQRLMRRHNSRPSAPPFIDGASCGKPSHPRLIVEGATKATVAAQVASWRCPACGAAAAKPTTEATRLAR
jgi:hypothetical protein